MTEQLSFNFTPKPDVPTECVADSTIEFVRAVNATQNVATAELLAMVGLDGVVHPHESVNQTLQRLENDVQLGQRAAAIRELAVRFNEESLRPGQQYRSSRDIFKHFCGRLAHAKQESMTIVLLDNKHAFITDIEISRGTLNRSLVHPREVFVQAIRFHSAAIICVHNHPSCDPIASQEDIEVTRRLVETGKTVGITLLDHIIIGGTKFFSLSDHNLL